MITRQMSEIYKITSELTNIPKSKVKELVEFQFQHFRDWAEAPGTYSYYFSYLGSWTPSFRRIRYKLLHMIARMREDPSLRTDPEYVKDFRFWWNYRHYLLNIYYYVKALKQRKGNVSRPETKTEI